VVEASPATAGRRRDAALVRWAAGMLRNVAGLEAAVRSGVAMLIGLRFFSSGVHQWCGRKPSR